MSFEASDDPWAHTIVLMAWQEKEAGKRRLALSQPDTCLDLLRTISANEATEIALAWNVN